MSFTSCLVDLTHLDGEEVGKLTCYDRNGQSLYYWRAWEDLEVIGHRC